MAHQVFLSHASEDREVASRVYSALEADGIACWMASRDLKAGTDYAAGTLEAIRTSELVLLIFSGSANASPFVLREIERAIAYDRSVLSLHIDDALPNASIEYYLNLWQWLEVREGVEGKHEEILAAVRGQLARLVVEATSSDAGQLVAAKIPGQPELGTGAEATKARRWSRRAWWFAVAALLVVMAGAGAGTWAATRAHHSTWTELHPEGSLPAPRTLHAMTYDPDTNRLIMFGGLAYNAGANDTQAYDPSANTWTNVHASGTLPSARWAHSMAYDPSTHRLIMFGGSSGPPYPLLNDTWVYNTTTNTWTELSPSGVLPPARGAQAMAYDPSSGRLIMFGGEAGGPDSAQHFLNDTWAYDPATNTWAELNPVGTLPRARIQPAMAYDPSSGRLIMFGGFLSSAAANDTWAYDPATNTWAELSPSGTLPLARGGHSIAYEPSTHRLILFGGSNGSSTRFNDTWAYDPAANTWTELKPSVPLPDARTSQSMVYDPVTGQVIMFGGDTDENAQGDTWAYTP